MRCEDRDGLQAGSRIGAGGATAMNQSAFIVRVPQAEPHVATLRERLDPSARLGVPAHITVLYPFMAPEQIDAALVAKVRAIATATAPFVFRLARIDRFPALAADASVRARPRRRRHALTQPRPARRPATAAFGTRRIRTGARSGLPAANGAASKPREQNR